MKQYDTFTFTNCSFDAEQGEISLEYSLDNEVEFEETIQLPPVGTIKPMTACETVQKNDQSLKNALFALHLAGGTSYY